VITLSGLSKRFGDVMAVRDLSLSLSPGSITLIYGPSGGGKTTLLRLIAGLELPDAGEIRIGGKLVSTPDGLLPPNKRGIGFLFQTPSLWPHLTVAQNILYGLGGLPRNERRQQLGEMVARLSLEGLKDRYPAQLSGGQAQRVSMARTLIVRPKRLLLDEPLSNLDPELRGQMITLIQEYLRETDATLLYVTHNLEDMANLPGRRLRLVAGRIVSDDEGGGG
jgi:iron(III) transport system ATP-binding protein